jgi:hypothetical protein
MTPPLHDTSCLRHTLRIRVPADERLPPVVQQWTGAPDGSICLLLLVAMGLTAVACWLGHVSGMPPATWWLLFS